MSKTPQATGHTENMFVTSINGCNSNSRTSNIALKARV